MKISIIAAIGKNRELGKDNKLLWNIPEDLKRFKQLTSGHPIIMGRKTFESIGRPLLNRTNIIITRDQDCKKEGIVIVHSLDDAIEKAQLHHKEEEVFIIGGGQIFEQAMPLADRLYLTVIDASFDADTFFPNYSEFKRVTFREKGESHGYTYEFINIER